MSSLVLWYDHAAFTVWQQVRDFLIQKWYSVIDVWPKEFDEDDDFPDYAAQACQMILSQDIHQWILICGTGIGMSIAANRYKWIRAVLSYNEEIARISRTHNNANIICFWSRTMDIEDIYRSLDVFLHTDFLWWKYQRRNEKLDN